MLCFELHHYFSENPPKVSCPSECLVGCALGALWPTTFPSPSLPSSSSISSALAHPATPTCVSLLFIQQPCRPPLGPCARSCLPSALCQLLLGLIRRVLQGSAQCCQVSEALLSPPGKPTSRSYCQRCSRLSVLLCSPCGMYPYQVCCVFVCVLWK